ncbi:site-2 protease family protein [Egicoccus sp. AB-alg2]|uniref:site-2 protease family protein n=1 Tax=Egicoccus sp. AB-alg2 TaxID=3242693 RepID=UPI00359D665D
MARSTWRVARLAGVDVRIDPSWILILFLIVSSFDARIVAAFPGTEPASGLLLALAGAIVFFGSVLVHELAHALVGRRRGYQVTGITLFVFGGATHAKVADRRPGDELLVSVVGPLTSGLVGAGLLLLASWLGGPDRGAPVWLLAWLGTINLFLAAFNLLPGLPLDGGRVLRSLVWARTGNPVLATRVASRAGVLLGYVLIALGLASLVTTGDLGGLWSVAIGWFLADAARREGATSRWRRRLRGVPAAALMEPDPPRVRGDVDVASAIADPSLWRRRDTAVVEEPAAGDSVGVVTLRRLTAVRPEHRSATPVADVMDPFSRHPPVDVHSDVGRMLDGLLSERDGTVTVADGGRVVGVIRQADVGRWLQRQHARGAAP